MALFEKYTEQNFLYRPQCSLTFKHFSPCHLHSEIPGCTFSC